MVLVTLAAFMLSVLVLISWSDLNSHPEYIPNKFDIIAIIICGLGVFLHNYYPK